MGMNPSSRETPGISLPTPVTEQAPGAAGGVPASERAPAAPETVSARGATQPAMALPTTQPPVLAAPVQGGAKPDDTSTSSSSTTVKDDKDKVEKEWVDRVKRIIEQTRHDPYRQSEELTAVKADYMKQHYNKIIKAEK